MRVDNANPTLYEPPPIDEQESGPKDEFLRLLVAQMQHQDPLEPQDGSEFVAQLAQFANIELGVETNTRLAALESAGVGSSRAAMMGLVGKQITADASQIELTGSATMPQLSVDLPGKADSVEVVVYDEGGNEVARIDAGAHPAGEFELDWDGTDSDGNPLGEGSYTLEVMASNGEEGAIEASLSLSGTTTSIEFAEDGSTALGLGGALISPAAIKTVEDGN